MRGALTDGITGLKAKAHSFVRVTTPNPLKPWIEHHEVRLMSGRTVTLEYRRHSPGRSTFNLTIHGRELFASTYSPDPRELKTGEFWQVPADGRAWTRDYDTRPGWRELWGTDKTMLSVPETGDYELTGEWALFDGLEAALKWCDANPATAVVSVVK